MKCDEPDGDMHLRGKEEGEGREMLDRKYDGSVCKSKGGESTTMIMR